MTSEPLLLLAPQNRPEARPVFDPRPSLRPVPPTRIAVPTPRVGDPCTPPPRVQRMVDHVSTGILEALQGRRPMSQLEVVFEDEAREAFAQLRDSAPGGEFTIHSSRTQMPSPRAVEVSLHLGCGRNSRAVAFRLEPVSGRWRCSRLEVALYPNGAICAASSSWAST